MKPLLVAVFLFFVAPGAAFAGASLTMREVPLHGERTLAAATPEFDLVGLHWRGSGAVQFRTRSPAGKWSAWRRADPEAEDLPNAGTAEARAEGGWRIGNPYWTGAADAIQYRLHGRVDRLRAYFVRSPEVRIPLRRVSMAGSPLMLSREVWGANEAIRRAPPSYAPSVQFALVHHTAGTNSYTASQSAAIVRGIEIYHVKGNGWNDIGYNFLVDKYGQVFEGRAGGIESAVVGAQAQGYNAQSTGIACLGTFSTVAQTEAGLDALARLIGWKLSLHGVPVTGQVTLTSAGGPSNRYPSGTPVPVNRVCGHRDGDNTSCPGDILYGQLDDLRNRAARYAGPVSGIVVRAASKQHGLTPVSLNGVLHFADGASPSGATLSVEYMTAGSAWTQITTTACGPDGTWGTSAVLPSSGKVRAVFAGDSGRPRVESGAITVEVIPRMNLAVDKRRAQAGTAFVVSGTMSPAQPRVVCLFERQVRGRWRTVQSKRIAVSSAGAYATKVKPKTPGLYRVSIIAVGVTRRRTLRATR
jgi:hypothetical protein